MRSTNLSRVMAIQKWSVLVRKSGSLERCLIRWRIHYAKEVEQRRVMNGLSNKSDAVHMPLIAAILQRGAGRGHGIDCHVSTNFFQIWARWWGRYDGDFSDFILSYSSRNVADVDYQWCRFIGTAGSFSQCDAIYRL